MRTKRKIGACIMVHNMAPLIGACIKSLQWVDEIFIFDDHSNDKSIETAQYYSNVPVQFEKATSGKLIFENGELKYRNYIIDRVFEKLKASIMIIVDADEMLSSSIKPEIIKILENPYYDSIAFSTWHLYNTKKYLHFWETELNKTKMIDPHTRIIKPGMHFVTLFKNGSHPIIRTKSSTKCFNAPYHFHLKYYHKSTLPNYSIYFLPERPNSHDIAPFLRKLPFKLPKDIASAMSAINWDKMPYYKKTPHYKLRRVKFIDPSEALIHPKEKIHEKA